MDENHSNSFSETGYLLKLLVLKKEVIVIIILNLKVTIASSETHTEKGASKNDQISDKKFPTKNFSSFQEDSDIFKYNFNHSDQKFRPFRPEQSGIFGQSWHVTKMLRIYVQKDHII